MRSRKVSGRYSPNSPNASRYDHGLLSRFLHLTLHNLPQAMHGHNVIHGDFKPANAVRLKACLVPGDEGDWVLCDLDASRPIGQLGGQKRDNSTAFAPPGQFALSCIDLFFLRSCWRSCCVQKRQSRIVVVSFTCQATLKPASRWTSGHSVSRCTMRCVGSPCLRYVAAACA